jgi:hypothetical protein
VDLYCPKTMLVCDEVNRMEMTYHGSMFAMPEVAENRVGSWSRRV